MMPEARRSSRLLVALASLTLAACHEAGPYGYAPTYAMGSGEKAALEGSKEYDPVMFVREPDAWRQKPVSLFGVVTSRTTGPGGTADVALSVRRLEPRNLCSNGNDDATCRVTVSDRDFGVVHARLSLKPEDDVGEHAVGHGSLLRLVGTFGDDVDPVDGAPVMRTTFYRHWPRHFYVTKANASLMRQ